MMLTCTIKDLLSWGPCDNLWTDDKIRAHAKKNYPRKRRWSALEILALRGVSHNDKLWVVLREELIDARTLRIFACDCTERALERERKAGHEPDPRSLEAVRVSRLYADGEATEAELSAAEAAARAAAWDAAEAAARAAARAAAWDAAEAAARVAARNAAWAAERRWQVARLKRLLKGVR